MSRIIDMLNNMETLREEQVAQEPLLPLSEDKIFSDLEKDLPPQKAKRSVLGRAAGWSLVVLLLTGSGVAMERAWPGRDYIPSLFGVSTAGETVSNKGVISIQTSPSSVGVLIGDQFVGATPLKFDWPAGNHRLALKLVGYHDLVTFVNVVAGRTQELDLSLFPKTGESQQVTSSATPVIEPPPAVASQAVAPPPVVAEVVKAPMPVVKKVVQSKKPIQAKQESRPAPVSADLAFIRGESALSALPPGVSDVEVAKEFKFNYAIQVGAFLDRDSAVAQAVYWKKKGYDAYILELWGIKDPTRLWQSVRIGHFNDLDQARATSEAFKAKEKVDGYVARWDSFAPPQDSQVAVAKSEAGPPVAASNHKQMAAIQKKPVVAKSPAALSEPTLQDAIEQEEKAILAAAAKQRAERDLAAKAEAEKRAEIFNKAAKEAAEKRAAAQAKAAQEREAKRVADLAKAAQEREAKRVADLAKAAQEREAKRVADLAKAAQEREVERVVDLDHYAQENGEIEVVPVEREEPQVVTMDAIEERPGSIAVTESKSDLRWDKNLKTNHADTPQSAYQMVQKIDRQADDLFQQAVRLKDQSKIPQAIDLLKQVLSLDAGHARARRRLARIYVETGKIREALELLREAVAGRNATQLSEEDPNLSAFLAALYQREEDHWHAIDLYENLLLRYPNKGVWHMGLAISLERVNEPSDALRAYTVAINSGDLSQKLRTFVQKRIRELK
ncbi:MAG: PEGA domain-containing protein [Magnetococcales bacterium]|nr:PEGA domain-containing protein [Magnetococcales bacterium]